MHALTNTSTPQQEANYLEDEETISNEKVSNPTEPESHEQDTSVHHNSPSNHQT